MRFFFLSFCSCLQKIKRREDHKSVNSVLVVVPLMPNNPLNSFGSIRVSTKKYCLVRLLEEYFHATRAAF